ncbi:hypothetical protein C5C36_13970 [Rathayibacter sp. AY1G1]|uniref:hypothetical protein n=1 Tax=Rathayibacter sp. AY1G1 TaxID=2080564 RepID=UPI000CE71E88|nr:hypothetical protein [Rathayibacter sp. AY1G1]PPH10473.1 hypothetical protein C5C36_13970 [Rathayibacter sp. AY1G1]
MPIPVSISVDEFPALNEQFYEMAPHRYLDSRLTALLLMVGEADDRTRRPASLRFGSITGEPDELSTQERSEYAAIESTVLLHHACEALLRIYLAHAHSNPCPWIALSEFTNPRAFKDAVRKLRRDLEQEETIADLLAVFTGSPDRSIFIDQTEERWANHREALVLLVHHCADVFLDQANIYNAAKHGLALGSQEVGISLKPPGDVPALERNGPTLNYLETAGPPHDKHWRRTLQFVQPDTNVGWVALILREIRVLWSIARHRRVRGVEEVHITFLEVGAVKELSRQETPNAMNLSGFSERLHGEEPPPAASGRGAR